MSESGDKLFFDTIGILESQRNRYPLLFVDQITEAVPGKSAVGIKNFTYNEWFFPAHYDDEPNVPGFVLIECLVQTFIMTFLSIEEYRGNKTNFLGIDNVKFRRKIVPGETMKISANLKSFKRGIAIGTAEGEVDGEFACCADFTVSLPVVFDKFVPPKSK